MVYLCWRYHSLPLRQWFVFSLAALEVLKMTTFGAVSENLINIIFPIQYIMRVPQRYQNNLSKYFACQITSVFSCDQAALWMVQSVRLSVRPSVCLSVRPSVCLSHLFDYVPIILSSWNFQELLPVTKVTSMQKVKVRGQRSRSQRSQPNLTVSGL